MGLMLACACAALVTFTPAPAKAQTYGSYSIGSFPTNTVPLAGGTTTNQSAVIDCRGNRHVNITLSFGAITNAQTATVSFLRSPDNVLYDDTALYTITGSAAANSICTTNTDWDIGAIGYLKFQKLVVGATHSITNPVVKVTLKPGS